MISESINKILRKNLTKKDYEVLTTKAFQNDKIVNDEDLYLYIAYYPEKLKLLQSITLRRKIVYEIIKPIRKQLEISDEQVEALKLKLINKKPEFLRQEYHRYKKLQKCKWRRPRGLHSKTRKELSHKRPLPKIGYGSDKRIRGLHPSGYQLINVSNLNDLDKITDVSKQAAIINSKVGKKKRMDIEYVSLKRKIYITNKRMLL